MTNHSIDELLRMRPEPPDPDEAFEARVRRAVAAELQATERDAPISPSDPDGHTTAEVLELDTITDRTTGSPTPNERPPRPWLRIAAAVVLVAGLVAAVAIARRDDPVVTSDDSSALFEDGFDDDSGGWTSGTSQGVTVTTGGGQQVWTLNAPGIKEVLRPFTMDEEVSDVEVTADVISVDPGATVGVMCRKGQTAPEDWYYSFRLGGAGASIVALSDGGVTLASDPTFAVPAEPFSLTGRCVDDGGVARLELLIDGDVVLTAQSDVDVLGPGVAAIEAIADADATDDPQIVLDRLVVHRI